MELTSPGKIEFTYPDEKTLVLRFSGQWNIYHEPPCATDFNQQFAAKQDLAELKFDTQHLEDWDSSLISFIASSLSIHQKYYAKINFDTLPKNIHNLLKMSIIPPRNKEQQQEIEKKSIFERRGEKAVEHFQHTLGSIDFIGMTALSFGKMLRGKAQFLWSDVGIFLQDTGIKALGIVALINFLIGLILAFIGAVQLKQFGAQLYVANLVSIGMTREMAPIMTAIIMAGRTGAAFAAQLGAMQVNEEIDALKTSAIQPHEFLVLPRMIALITMMPLLCLYADVVGILGGAVVGVGMLHISLLNYSIQTFGSIGLSDILIGVIKASIFGILIALAGCQLGMQCGRSASAVGESTTSAVVKSILYIIVADALITILLYALNI